MVNFIRYTDELACNFNSFKRGYYGVDLRIRKCKIIMLRGFFPVQKVFMISSDI